jgi:hypothetical protein
MTRWDNVFPIYCEVREATGDAEYNGESGLKKYSCFRSTTTVYPDAFLILEYLISLPAFQSHKGFGVHREICKKRQ